MSLLAACHRRGIPVLCVAGAGAKADPSRLRIADVSESNVDPLARAVRCCCGRCCVTPLFCATPAAALYGAKIAVPRSQTPMTGAIVSWGTRRHSGNFQRLTCPVHERSPLQRCTPAGSGSARVGKYVRARQWSPLVQVRKLLRRRHGIDRGISVVLSTEKPRCKLVDMTGGGNLSDFQVSQHHPAMPSAHSSKTVSITPHAELGSSISRVINKL